MPPINALPREARWIRRGDQAALAVVALIFAGAFWSQGYAEEGVLRQGAWALCGLLGCWSAVGFAAGRWSRDHAGPVARFLAILCAACAFAILFLLPLPSGVVAAINPLKAEIAGSMATAGIPLPGFTPLAAVPESAARSLQQLIASMLFFSAVAMMAYRRSGAAALLAIIAIATVAEGLLGIFNYTVAGYFRASGAAFNANHHAAMLSMGLPVCIGGLIVWRGLSHTLSRNIFGGTNPLLFLWVLIAGATMGWFAAFSRSSLLFFSIAMAGWAVVEIIGRMGGGRRRVTLAVVIAAVAVPLLLGAGAMMFPRFVARLVDDDALSGNSRFMIWRACWRGLAETNYLGLGPGGCEFMIDRFAGYPLLTRPIWAHNDYLQWTCDFGLPAMLVLAALAVWTIAAMPRFLSHWRAQTAFGDWLLFRACAAGLFAGLAHSLTDFHLRIPLIGFTCLTLIAVLLQPGHLKATLYVKN